MHPSIIECNLEDNLYVYPKVNKTSYPLICLGDLHGNALKLLHFLLKVDAVYFPEKNRKKLYQEFIYLYKSIDFDKGTLITIRNIIGQLKVGSNKALLRFLGDELADRGENDLITLFIFEFLNKNNIAYDCCFSNHSFVFFKNYKKTILDNETYDEIPQYKSFTRFYISYKSKYISLGEIKKLVDLHKNHYQIVSLNITDDCVYQFTHAPTSHNIIKHLANKFETPYFDNTVEELAFSVTKINQKFLSHFENYTINELFSQPIISLLANKEYIEENNYPLECAIWNRNYDKLDREINKQNYYYGSVHGHDRGEKSNGSIINLDNLFGASDLLHKVNKNINNPILFQNYKLLCLDENQILEHIKNNFLREISQVNYSDFKHLESCDAFLKKYKFLNSSNCEQLISAYTDLNQKYEQLLDNYFNMLTESYPEPLQLSSEKIRNILDRLSGNLFSNNSRTKQARQFYNQFKPMLNDILNVEKNIKYFAQKLKKSLNELPNINFFDNLHLCFEEILQFFKTNNNYTIIHFMGKDFEKIFVNQFKNIFNSLYDNRSSLNNNFILSILNKIEALALRFDIDIDDSIVLFKQKTFPPTLAQRNNYPMCNLTEKLLYRINTFRQNNLSFNNLRMATSLLDDLTKLEVTTQKEFYNTLQRILPEMFDADLTSLKGEYESLTSSNILNFQHKLDFLVEITKILPDFFQFETTKKLKELILLYSTKCQLLSKLIENSKEEFSFICLKYKNHLDKSIFTKNIEEKKIIVSTILNWLQGDNFNIIKYQGFVHFFNSHAETLEHKRIISEKLAKPIKKCDSIRDFFSTKLSFFSNDIKKSASCSHGYYFVEKIKEKIAIIDQNIMALAVSTPLKFTT